MDSIGDIKERLSVEEVVGDYVQLKQAGRNFKGLCPFHHEKTPSFMVSPEKGIFHCFGCGAGGDIFTFVQRADGLDFRESLEVLAKRAGVELPQKGSGDSQAARKKKARILEALESASKYYHIQLSKDEAAWKYVFKQREFGKEATKEFRLGWAPAEGDRLVKFMRKQGFSDRELADAGLARQQSRGMRDLFRSRIMVPFFDPQGNIVGFTARIVGDGMPKYLNTPQTSVFDKSRFIFGLFQAKQGIRSADEVVVVEGNLDVISSHQAGVDNVVALSGTALTRPQLKALSRLTSNVTLAFDADDAGVRATERSINLAQEEGVNLSVVTLPKDKDPDDIIKSNPKQWKQLLADKHYVLDWLIDTFESSYDLASATGKREFTSRISDSLRRIKDPVEREHYIQVVSDLVHVPPTAITDKLASAKELPEKRLKRTKQAPKESSGRRDDVATVATALLSLAVTYPETRSSLDEVLSDYLDQESKELLDYLKQTEAEIAAEKLPPELQGMDNYVKILLLRGEEEYGSWALLDRQVEAFSLAHRLQELQTRRNKQHLSREIAAAEAAGDNELRSKLLKRYQELNNFNA